MENITEENFKALENHLNADANAFLKTSEVVKDFTNEQLKLRAQIAKLEADNLILKGFCQNYLTTMEGFDDEDENTLSIEHKLDYINCAKHFELRYNRFENRISVMQDYIDKY
jgi:uncharacterized protein YutD